LGLTKLIWAFAIAVLLLATVAQAKANLHDNAATADPAPGPIIQLVPPQAPPAIIARPDLRGTAEMPVAVDVTGEEAAQITAGLRAAAAAAGQLTARMFELQATLLLFLLLLTFALLYQGYWARRGSLAASRQFALTHRPNLRIRHIWRQGELAPGAPVTVDLLVVNTGLVPAVVKQVRLAMVVLPNGREVPADLLSLRRKTGIFPVIIEGERIAPIVSGGSYLFAGITDGKALTRKQNDELRDRTSKLYLVGSIEYQDIYSSGLRTTGFCRYLAVIDQRAVPAFSDVGRFRLVEESEYEFED
jgi:hypothetical protein